MHNMVFNYKQKERKKESMNNKVAQHESRPGNHLGLSTWDGEMTGSIGSATTHTHKTQP
jgi:hypothetical protein